VTLFSRLLARTRHRATVAAVYGAIVAAARHPRLYDSWGVPDTVDGRFDMVALHLILVLDRLRKEGPDDPFSQQLTDYFFADMDRSLREMGAGDLSVGKKVRRMAEVFYGRAKAYAAPLAAGDREGLAEALARNVYANPLGSGEALRLAAYAIAASEHLRRLGARGILEGRLEFGEPGTP
jgi:cytochrome b pre-mRNA-processing protein 3